MMKFNKFIILLTIVTLLTFDCLAFSRKELSTSSIWVELERDLSKKNEIKLPSLAPLVSKVENSVLVVTTEIIIKQKQQNLPPELERGPFRDFFKFFSEPQDHGYEQKTRGQGSGFIIHPSGLALTNYHVVEGANSIKIKVGNNLQEYEAKVIGFDINTDIALIKIKNNKIDWPVIPLGSSKNLKVGDFAIAIGNPFGLELSVSMGIVSARGRRQVAPSGRRGLYDFIQIDNSINFGNSGGPLLNLAGEAVGINTAISAQGHGIAFSIPIDQVKKILPQLKENGEASQAYLGVRILDVLPNLAKVLGMKTPHGALVREVTVNSPAFKAGVKAGDVITHFNNKIIKDSSSLKVMSGLSGVNKIVIIKLLRNKEERFFGLKLEKILQEEKNNEKINSRIKDTIKIKSLGFSVANINNEIKKKLNISEEINGALVVSLKRGSVANFFGIEINDLIISINQKKIKSAKNFSEIIDGIPSGNILRILLKRGCATIFIALSKP